MTAYDMEGSNVGDTVGLYDGKDVGLAETGCNKGCELKTIPYASTQYSI